jgi:predicted glycosyltransferase involved in capsule biosynthesis
MKHNIYDDLTVVIVSMNRTDHLLANLKHMDTIDEIRNVIVVDWNSIPKISINQTIKNTNIKIYRVSNENSWWLTKSYNLGFELANSKFVLKLDADALLDQKKLEEIKYLDYDLAFLSSDKENKKIDMGNFVIKKEIFMHVNGFNEFIWGWGYDEIDLFRRIRRNMIDEVVIYNGVKKFDHDLSRSIESQSFQGLNKDIYFKSLLKAQAASNEIVANSIAWDTQYKRNYEILNDKVKINHNFSPKNLSRFLRIMRKYKFVSVFLSFSLREKNYLYKILLSFYITLRSEKYFRKYFLRALYP